MRKDKGAPQCAAAKICCAKALPPPPPLTGANALPVQHQPNRQQYQQVNRVEENRDQPPTSGTFGPECLRRPTLVHGCLVTEPTEQSVHRRSMEVNAVMPAVPKYMLWSSEELAEHSLNVRKDAKPVRQPLRRFAEDRRKIIGEEVTKLLVAGFIVEVTHTEWLANPVMVEKKKDENLEAQAPKGDHLRYVLQVHFRASNNVAEYEALVHGLKVAKEIGVLRIICYGDSDLVVQQCSGDWDAKDANMASYRFHVQKIAGFFEGCEFHHVPRAENEAADALSKLGSSRQEIPPGIALAHLRIPSIKPSPESESIFVPESHVVPMEIDEGNPGTVPANSGTVPVNSGTATLMPEEAMLVDSMDIDMPVFVVREAPSWVKPIKFLVNGTLPVDENESRRIQRRSKAYTIINGEAYKRSVTGVLQRCVEPEDSSRRMRAPRLVKGTGGKSVPAWILLANGFGKCGGYGKKMQWVPEVRQTKPYPGIRFKNHTANLAIRCLVPGHGWTIQNRKKHDPHLGNGG
ncbi:hypothetical protein QYE76_062790 [Lolium multiflorum]|uniref:RNase H type-1 domain-containing protein n=1 Tax=Lolium multiflorum TaxID=4521 RepID=A0AAD8S5V5_LOLMU|nr:hypothetical protein QYE76_062790 [Lolium multiflorum]